MNKDFQIQTYRKQSQKILNYKYIFINISHHPFCFKTLEIFLYILNTS